MERFDGKVVSVTGGAMGIGKGIAYRLARDGAAVAIGDVDEAGARAAANEIAEETGARMLGMKCDVTRKAEVDAFVAATVDKFGRLDVMFGNAGIAIGQMGMETTEETWNRTMTINGLGIVLSTQAAAREMIKEGHGGAIINLSSIAALNGVSANLMAYSASKAAVMQLSRCFALELAPHKIRVNTIAPGLVDTAIWGKMINMPDILDRGMRDSMANSTPLGRMATPADIAAMAAFLASDDAEFITGQIFPVEGGRTVGLPSAPPRG